MVGGAVGAAIGSGDSLSVRVCLPCLGGKGGGLRWCGGLVWGLFGCVLGMVVSCWGGWAAVSDG